MNSTEIAKILKDTEGLRLTAYQDTGGVWTIGYGATFYENGIKVKSTDKITLARAKELLVFHMGYFEKQVKNLLKVSVNDNQLSSLILFCFNVGQGNLQTSTLLKKVNKNPNDKSISDEFDKWIYDNGKIEKGLITKRKLEKQLYFKPINFISQILKPQNLIPLVLFFYSVFTISL